MIHLLWSKLVRLLGGEMDEHVLKNEVWRKAMHGHALTPEETALLPSGPQADLAVRLAAANRAFGVGVREIAQAWRAPAGQ